MLCYIVRPCGVNRAALVQQRVQGDDEVAGRMRVAPTFSLFVACFEASVRIAIIVDLFS